MENLIEITTGTRVYHKEYGIGIVTNPQSHAPYGKGHTNYIAVWFENQIRVKRLHRNELFVRGDKVFTINCKNGKLNIKETFTFYAYMDHNLTNVSNYTVLDTFEHINYYYDVKHYEEPKSKPLGEDWKTDLNAILERLDHIAKEIRRRD